MAQSICKIWLMRSFVSTPNYCQDFELFRRNDWTTWIIISEDSEYCFEQILKVNINIKTLSFHHKRWTTIRINQLPDSVARWWHGSHICFSIFTYWKVTTLLITQQPLKLEKKLAQIWKSYNFRNSLLYVWPNLKSTKLYLI